MKCVLSSSLNLLPTRFGDRSRGVQARGGLRQPRTDYGGLQGSSRLDRVRIEQPSLTSSRSLLSSRAGRSSRRTRSNSRSTLPCHRRRPRHLPCPFRSSHRRPRRNFGARKAVEGCGRVEGRRQSTRGGQRGHQDRRRQGDDREKDVAVLRAVALQDDDLRRTRREDQERCERSYRDGALEGHHLQRLLANLGELADHGARCVFFPSTRFSIALFAPFFSRVLTLDDTACASQGITFATAYDSLGEAGVRCAPFFLLFSPFPLPSPLITLRPS